MSLLTHTWLGHHSPCGLSQPAPCAQGSFQAVPRPCLRLLLLLQVLHGLGGDEERCPSQQLLPAPRGSSSCDTHLLCAEGNPHTQIQSDSLPGPTRLMFLTEHRNTSSLIMTSPSQLLTLFLHPLKTLSSILAGGILMFRDF